MAYNTKAKDICILGDLMKIAVIQLCSALEPEKNLKKIQKFIDEAKKESSGELEAVFLPEVFYSMSDGTQPTPYLVEPGNEHYLNIQKLAKDNSVYLIGGTAATKLGDKVINRTYNFDKEGKELNNYDKIHLFSVNLSLTSNKTVVDETLVYSAGEKSKILNIGNWKIGLGICFDLRFPELYRDYFAQGANLMTACAAFTVPTGKAHWETLVRSRAIENQSYVVAAGQWGVHNDKISTYGHSLIIEPWGEIIADGGEGEKYLLADLDLQKVLAVRSRMNVDPRIDMSGY